MDKHTIVKIIFLILILLPATAQAGLSYPTLFNNIESADFIFLGECIAVSKDSFDIQCASAPTGRLQGPMMATYNIIQTWKDYNGKDFFVRNFESINKALSIKNSQDRLPPKTKTPYVPEVGQYAYLFIKDGEFLNNDYNGFVPVDMDSSKLNTYNKAITRLVEISGLEPAVKIEALYTASVKSVDENYYLSRCANVALKNIPIEFYIDNIYTLTSSGSKNVIANTLERIKPEMNSWLLEKTVPFLYDTTSSVWQRAYDAIYSYNPEYLRVNWGSYNNNVKKRLIFDSAHRPRALCHEFYYQAAIDKNDTIRADGLSALRSCKNERACEIIYSALDDDNHEIQLVALEAAGDYLLPDLTPFYYEALNNQDIRFRNVAVSTLFRIYDKFKDTDKLAEYGSIPDTLLKIAKSTDSTYVRRNAIVMLINIDKSYLGNELAELLFDRDSVIRHKIAFYIRRSRDESFIPLLKEALVNETDNTVIIEMQNGLLSVYGLDTIEPAPKTDDEVIELQKRKIEEYCRTNR